MSWATVKLGDICTIEKGQTGIQKAIPGAYPLVVTSEERKSHIEFQFDDEAVIIPLVSGTGHGHASIKRIHYQNGKFALGSILCAVIPKDKTILNPEYLFRFLELNKENELVARMRGMANVTLPMKEIAKIEIPLPPLKVQIEFVNSYKILVEKNSLLLDELDGQLNLIKQLRQSFLREAMQGKLVKSKHIEGQETGLQLLEKIGLEKAKLIAEKKLKKEKELPPINEKEIPFDIPKNWTWCKLQSITNFIDYRGKTPNKIKEGIKLITAKNVKFGFFSSSPEEYISENEYFSHMSRGIPNNGDILFTTEAPLGNACILNYDNKFALAQRIITIQPVLVNNHFLLNALLSDTIQNQLIKKQSGATAKGIKSSRLVEILIPLPPFHEQQQIVSKLDKIKTLCDNLEQSINKCQNYNDMLLQQVLREALQPKEETVLDIDSLFEDKNYNLHVAMIQTLIESQLGINHGEVANQKTIFHINTFTNEKIPYQFVNHNFGTFSQQLREDFNRNPYLTKATKNNKEVFIVKSSKQKEVLDSIYKPENKNFVNAVKEILDIYELPFINKETDKIELLNTVSKLIIDLKSADLDIIYQGMKDWKIIQQGFSCKADKFSKLETERMIKLIQNKGLGVRMLKK